MIPSLSPERLISVIEGRTKGTTSTLQAFWYSIFNPREDYARGINNYKTSSVPIVALVPRKAGMFEAPNALFSDLVDLMNDNRGEFDRINGEMISIGKPLVILIISRSSLAIPGGCSPITLPSWIPRIGGSVVNIEIDDLTYSADGPLNSVEATLPVICEALYQLELSLLKHLNVSINNNLECCDNLFKEVGLSKHDARTYIELMQTQLAEVKNPAAFRPSVKKGNTMISLIVKLYSSTSPDKLTSKCSSLAEALGCNLDHSNSIVSVLLRPTYPTPTNLLYCRDLIITVFAAYQYITAAAHAGEYPSYPVALIHTLSKHIIGHLTFLKTAIESCQ